MMESHSIHTQAVLYIYCGGDSCLLFGSDSSKRSRKAGRTGPRKQGARVRGSRRLQKGSMKAERQLERVGGVN